MKINLIKQLPDTASRTRLLKNLAPVRWISPINHTVIGNADITGKLRPGMIWSGGLPINPMAEKAVDEMLRVLFPTHPTIDYFGPVCTMVSNSAKKGEGLLEVLRNRLFNTVIDPVVEPRVISVLELLNREDLTGINSTPGIRENFKFGGAGKLIFESPSEAPRQLTMDFYDYLKIVTAVVHNYDSRVISNAVVNVNMFRGDDFVQVTTNERLFSMHIRLYGEGLLQVLSRIDEVLFERAKLRGAFGSLGTADEVSMPASPENWEHEYVMSADNAREVSEFRFPGRKAFLADQVHIDLVSEYASE